MFVVVVHYCVQLLPAVEKIKHFFYFVPLLLICFFTFLVPFFCKSQKCPISQHIQCLVKTQLKTALKQFFKGVVHEQPWSSIVCFLWWSSIVSSCCLRWKISNMPFTFSFAKAFSFTFWVSFGILRNAQFPKICDALLKPPKKTASKQFFKGVVHEQP